MIEIQTLSVDRIPMIVNMDTKSVSHKFHLIKIITNLYKNISHVKDFLNLAFPFLRTHNSAFQVSKNTPVSTLLSHNAQRNTQLRDQKNFQKKIMYNINGKKHLADSKM